AVALLPGEVLGTTAVAPAAEAAAHDRWDRQVRADSADLPRRGSACGPHLRSDAAGHRNDLRRARRRHGCGRGLLHGGLRAVREKAAPDEALPENDVRGSHTAIRHRPPGYTLRDGACGSH